MCEYQIKTDPTPPMALATYKVLFDFTAEDQDELSVSIGSFVMSDGTNRDGWMYCERVGEPGKVGFVPADYVERVTVVPSVPVATPAPAVSESRGKAGSEPPLAVQPTYTAMEKVVAPPTPAVVAADDAMLAQLRSRAIMSQDITTGGHPSSANADFSHFSKSHEEWFQEATQKRAETFGALQTALDDLLRRMTECEERNASIVTSLTELDHLLQDEKAKWTDTKSLTA